MLPTNHRYDRNAANANFYFATQTQCNLYLIYSCTVLESLDPHQMLGKKLPLSTTKNLPFVTLSPITDPNKKVVISSKHVQD